MGSKRIEEAEPKRLRRVRVTKQGTWCPVEVTQQSDPHEAEQEPTSPRHMRVTKQDTQCLVEVTQQGDPVEAANHAGGGILDGTNNAGYRGIRPDTIISPLVRHAGVVAERRWQGSGGHGMALKNHVCGGHGMALKSHV